MPAATMKFPEADAARIEAALSRIAEVAGEEVLREVLEAAAAPVFSEIRSRAPRGKTELLSRSIRSRFRKSPRKGLFAQTIAVDAMRREVASTRRRRGVPSDRGRYEVYYAGFVEYGHRIASGDERRLGGRMEKTTSTAGPGGMVPENPFLRPAYDAREGEAMAIIEQKLMSLITW